MVTINNDQDVFSKRKNVTRNYNLKSNINIVKVDDEIDVAMATDYGGKTITNEVKNDVVSASVLENCKDEIMLFDLDEAFIQEHEMDCTKQKGPLKT